MSDYRVRAAAMEGRGWFSRFATRLRSLDQTGEVSLAVLGLATVPTADAVLLDELDSILNLALSHGGHLLRSFIHVDWCQSFL